MSRTSQQIAPGSSACEVDSTVALIEAGAPDERIAAILEEQGWEFELLESLEELLGGAAAPTLVVLRVTESLSGAVARKVEPLRRKLPDTLVVIVCAEIRPGELRVALAAGVAGLVLESELAAALGSCLKATRAGQVCVPMRQARQVEPSALSPREKQILGLVVMGYMNSEIAAQLFVAESTVKSHLSSVFAKLGVRSRSEAVDLVLDPKRGLRMGILELGGERIEPRPVAK